MAPIVSNPSRRILFLDAYDSFSNNIVALIEQNTDAKVTKVFIDDAQFLSGNSVVDPTFVKYAQEFDAVVAGPGPGWAGCDKDVGLMKELWNFQEQILPVLGICLGFQSLCLAFGADLERLAEPKHGIVTTVLHNRQSLFRQVEKVQATQYHSLHVKLGHPIQTMRAVRYPAQLWEPTEKCPQLEPLAWDFDSERNGAVLMGVKHVQKPFWGVQFHPESVCTNEAGARIIRNWWEDAQAWKRKRILVRDPRKTALTPPQLRPKTFQDFQRDLGLVVESDTEKVIRHEGKSEETLEFLGKNDRGMLPVTLAYMIAYGDGKGLPCLPPTTVHCATTGSGRLTVEDVCELLEIPKHEAIVLQSGLQENLVPSAVGTGRYSIIGLVIPGETLRLHYYAGARIMQLRGGHDQVIHQWKCWDAWPYICKVMGTLGGSPLWGPPIKPPRTKTEAPFFGGLMGFASYEAGLQSIDVTVKDSADHPDICFAYITRSIVFDHQLKKIYMQSIRGPNDFDWVKEMQELIYNAADAKSRESTPTSTPLPRPDPFEEFGPMYQYIDSCKQNFADRETYCEQVRSCQEAIADGQSYELCLTHQNEIRARKPTACRLSKAEDSQHSWKLYKRLAGQNPAPFGAYMRMHNVHILSSSPERYMSWSRDQTVQCRPIKGTVQKRPGVTAAHAHAILSSSKERAENLMIVDLTRHQLHGVYGSENVRVSQLMEVEEYETVWQLVTVVEAALKPFSSEDGPDFRTGTEANGVKWIPLLGLQAFTESLPPGSMTGAPKKRSCEILQEQERGVKRGIYSGVLGYLDVCGGGDFSVVIRTAIKVDPTPYHSSPTKPKSFTDPHGTPSSPSTSTKTEDIWRIPAGGAVTSQSTPEGEYEEMLAKFNSTSRAFTHLPPPPPKQKKPRVELINAGHPDYEALWADTLAAGGEAGLGAADVEEVLRLLQETVQRTLAQGIGIVDEDDIGDDEDDD
jgi:para-aminobenzoate synthetase